MPPSAITSLDHFGQLFQNELVVLYFTAVWCGPCKAIAPLIDQLSESYSNVETLNIDLDDFRNLASKYSISAVPTFVFFHKAKEVDRVRGANVQEISFKFEELSKLNPNAKKFASSRSSEIPKEIIDFLTPGYTFLNNSILFGEFESLNGLNLKDTKDLKDLVRSNPEDQSTAYSDADSQLLLHIPFTNISKISSLLIKSETTTEDSQKPNIVKIWGNRSSIISFDDIDSVNPLHAESIEENKFVNGWYEIKLKLVKFQKISSLDLFFDGDDEDSHTLLDRIFIIGVDGEAKSQGKIERIGDD
ncbi:hypothetical protein WICMUC_000101 [Wickerhamomyces mucosus]|uniref:Thioredoxin domain-containing protein n=1 Tax=Wickerhamomyces mucosus TaxID=1378264 RepID=A0A9P8PYI9_9ASCO|nr:hypothetical protein WICMUC_000101 [Wickerhamomyces mucosus]